MSWAEDPELLATFRAEVEERLASLSAGLLQLEGHAAPRQLVAGLFRDAHTIKGSARMLGVEPLLRVAHACEDSLGLVRDGRREPDRELVDELLAACDEMARLVETDVAAGLSPTDVAEGPSTDLGPGAPSTEASEPTSHDGSSSIEPAVSSSGPRSTRPMPASGPGRPAETVRVSSAKVYGLLDDVGEAELAVRALEHSLGRLTFGAVAGDGSGAATAEVTADQGDVRAALEEARSRLDRVRDGAMALAMVPLRRATAGLPRIVRDVAAAGGKDVALLVDGEDVELDKQVLDAVADSLKHLVTNAVDHGCEPSGVRTAAGKPARATVTVRARSAGDHVVIEVSDDGAGIDPGRLRESAARKGIAVEPGRELRLLFTPGFSTAATITATSGRGVGLDVVASAVEALGGAVDVRSEIGAGTTFALTLPVTLGVLHCLLARVGDERYALPVASVVESISLRHLPVHEVGGATVVVRNGATLPLLDLGAALGASGERAPAAAVVVRHGGRPLAWAVDRLDGEEHLVVKELGPFLGRRPALLGATIDPDGRVICIVDVRDLAGDDGAPSALARSALGRGGQADRPEPGHAAAAPPRAGQPSTRGHHPTAMIIDDTRRPIHLGSLRSVPTDGRPAGKRPRVLVVEDSVGVRELERAILEAAGYDVDTAVDGLDGAARLRDEPADLVLSDVEMPGMDGFTLTRTIRETRGWEHVPVLIMTSRGSPEDQRAGLDAGANAYLLKSEFDQAELIDTVRRLVGR
jgi:chemotaxis protein histidine kinase CheA